MYISLWENSRGHPDNVSFMQFSTKIDGFEQKDSQGFENSYNSYEQYPLEKFLIFTIYQNYTLALKLFSEYSLNFHLISGPKKCAGNDCYLFGIVFQGHQREGVGCKYTPLLKVKTLPFFCQLKSSTKTLNEKTGNSALILYKTNGQRAVLCAYYAPFPLST